MNNIVKSLNNLIGIFHFHFGNENTHIGGVRALVPQLQAVKRHLEDIGEIKYIDLETVLSRRNMLLSSYANDRFLPHGLALHYNLRDPTTYLDVISDGQIQGLMFAFEMEPESPDLIVNENVYLISYNPENDTYVLYDYSDEQVTIADDVDTDNYANFIEAIDDMFGSEESDESEEQIIEHPIPEEQEQIIEHPTREELEQLIASQITTTSGDITNEDEQFNFDINDEQKPMLSSTTFSVVEEPLEEITETLGYIGDEFDERPRKRSKRSEDHDEFDSEVDSEDEDYELVWSKGTR